MKDSLKVTETVSFMLNGKPVAPGPINYCPEKLKPGGCQLHNLHCEYPKCNQPPQQK